MADSAAKRQREARKRRRREIKVERKRLRKEGLLGNDPTGLFPPGAPARPVVDPRELEVPETEGPAPEPPPA